jgi:hypothetical protein
MGATTRMFLGTVVLLTFRGERDGYRSDASIFVAPLDGPGPEYFSPGSEIVNTQSRNGLPLACHTLSAYALNG